MEQQPIDIVSTLAKHGFGDQAKNIERKGYIPTEKDGVTTYSGDHKGVPFRFFIYTPVLEHASKTSGYKQCDAVECIEWLTNKTNHPTAIVRAGHLPPELLDFEVHTIPQEFHPEHGYQINTQEYHQKVRELKPVGGLLYEAYCRWKEGREAEGSLLSKWEGLGERDLATFNENGIYTLEQLASLGPDRTRRWSEHMRNLQEQAILEINEREHMQEAQARVAELGKIEDLLAAAQKRNEELEARLAKLEEKPKATASKRKTQTKKKTEESEE